MFLTVMALLSMTMTFAEDKELNATNSVNVYNMEVNYGKLAECLNLTASQTEAVADIHNSFCVDMMNVATAKKEERKEMLDKAVLRDLKHMRYVLDKEQFRKYRLLLNTTFNNRGLNK